ncbi:MAG TPA: adenylate kinase [Holophaga sp.]|nr:adenylate kinase [Holophaga sp.]
MKVHILLGAPGCGKGTQAKRLVSKMSLIHLSTGDILRDAVSKGTEIGLRAKAIMASGKLVDDDTVNGLVFARLQNESGDVLFDGYPRTLAQAEALETFLSNRGLGLGYVIDIFVPESALEARVVDRMVCSNNDCGAIYHLVTKPPFEAGKCDVCHSPLKHRADDCSEAFRARMVEFNKTFQPLQAHYKGTPHYRSVDGLRSPDEIHGTILDLFQEQH